MSLELVLADCRREIATLSETLRLTENRLAAQRARADAAEAKYADLQDTLRARVDEIDILGGQVDRLQADRDRLTKQLRMEHEFGKEVHLHQESMWGWVAEANRDRRTAEADRDRGRQRAEGLAARVGRAVKVLDKLEQTRWTGRDLASLKHEVRLVCTDLKSALSGDGGEHE